ncbi:TonB-dependent receptor [Desulfonatronospira sp.]|uniref:TonB-dependent receptor plug domain-containing protein n=1 Tax=Desulfonatronospira sp. TaxID=1962951 RepID=UPI0025C21705|nr:TonB-dependent receptor [Desulfonatronospira sp.]
MAKKIIIMALLLTMAGGPAPAAEEEPARLEEFVVSATMTQKYLSDAPGSIEVITSKQMEEMNALTVADALENSVGLIVSRESGRTRVPSIRGARSKHTLVLMDGRRLAFGFNDMIDLRQIPVVMVDRIEIVRGPASALYGSDALGGVVNIITRKAPYEWSGEARTQFGINKDGDAKEYVGSAMVGGPLDRFRFLLSAEKRKKDGWNKTSSLPDDGFEESPLLLSGRFSFDLTDSQMLSAGVEYTDNKYEGGQFYERMDRTRNFDEERRGYFAQYDAHFSDVHDIMLRVNRSEYENKMRFDPDARSGRRNTSQYVNQAEARYSGLYFDSHLVTLGFDFRRDELDDTQMGELRNKEHVNNFSVFLQDEFNIFDPLYLVLGLRYDNHSEYGDQWTTRASTIYSLSDSIRVRASFGQGFRAPSHTELYVTSLRRRGQEVYEANPDLKAEKSTSYELGIEGDFDIVYAGLTGFYTDVENLIESIFDRVEGSGRNRKSYYQWDNIAKATIKGIEAEAGLRLPHGFSVDGNLTWMDIDNKSGGEDIGAQPKYKGFVKLGYEYPDWRLKANLRMSYTGRMEYAEGDRYSYTLFGTYISKGFGPNFEIFAGVDNIFNKTFERNNVTQIEPTTFYGGLSYRF